MIDGDLLMLVPALKLRTVTVPPIITGINHASGSDVIANSGIKSKLFVGQKLSAISSRLINKGLDESEHLIDGEINAMVTIQGRPVSRPVYVLNQQCERVYITHSDSQGRYRATGLDTDERYIVLALDKPGREYNAAISDYVQPESV